MYEFLDYQVRDVMSAAVSIGADTTLSEVEQLLEKNGFNAVPVVDRKERLIGVVSTLDLLRAFRLNGESTLPPIRQDHASPGRALQVAPAAHGGAASSPDTGAGEDGRGSPRVSPSAHG